MAALLTPRCIWHGLCAWAVSSVLNHDNDTGWGSPFLILILQRKKLRLRNAE